MQNLMLSTSTLQNFHLICSCSQTTDTTDPVHYSELLFTHFITHFCPIFHHSTEDFLLLATSGCTLGPFLLKLCHLIGPSYFQQEPINVPGAAEAAGLCPLQVIVKLCERQALLLPVKHCSWQGKLCQHRIGQLQVLGLQQNFTLVRVRIGFCVFWRVIFQKKINALYWMYLLLV